MSPITPRCCLARFPRRPPPRPPRPPPSPSLAGVLGLSGSQFTSRGLLVADAARHGARWVRGGMLVRAPRRRCRGSRAPYRVLARAYVRHMWLSMRHPRRLVTPLALVCSPLRARCPTPPHLPSTPSPAPLTVPYRRRTRARDALPPPRTAACTAVGGGRGFDEPPPPKSLQPSPPAAPPARPRTLACDRRCSKRSPTGTREQPPSCNEPPGRMGSMAQSGECPTTKPPPTRAPTSRSAAFPPPPGRHRQYQYHRHHTLPITTTTQPHPATDPNQRRRHPPPRPPPPPPCLCPLLPSRDQLVAVGRGGLILR